MKFSIITVTFNSEKTVRETFESVLCQSYRPLQYIIIDGLSTDDTMNIVYEYENKFFAEGIEFLYKSEKDKGISDAFNKGIQRANGDIIGIINSDDLLYEEALNIIASEYEEGIDIYYGDCMIFNDSNDDRFIAKPKTEVSILRRSMCLFHPACFVTKEAYNRFGGFRTDLKYCMDRELLLRLYVNGCKFKYIDKVLACYREGGVNQKYYKLNQKEGMKISTEYGTSKSKAYIEMLSKKTKHYIWRTIQFFGAEKYIHKKV